MSERKRPRILVLAPNKPGTGLGGAERHLKDLADALLPLAESVNFLSRADCPLPSGFERLLLRIEPMLASPLAVRRLMRRGIPDADVLITVELMGVGIQHPRHIHLFFGSYSGFREMALPPVTGARNFVRMIKSRLARELERRTQGRFGAIATSDGVKQVLHARGIPALDTSIVPPTDCDRFTPGNKLESRKALSLPQNKRLLLFAGRWEYAKGADRCCRLLELLSKDWHLVVATPSEYTWPLPDPDRATFLTDLTTEQMIAAYRASDILIQPSRFEGYSLVASEAQACGCPVITSPVGHAVHFLNSADPDIRASVISQPDDPFSWSAAIQGIVENDEKLDALAKTHRKYAVEHVSLPQIRSEFSLALSNIFEEFSWQPR